MAMIRERGIVLEICPTSNLNTGVVSGWDEFRWDFDTLRRNGVRFTISTDGPEMLKTYIRDGLATLGRLESVRRGAGAGGRDGDGRVLRPERVRRAAHRSPAADPRSRGARGSLIGSYLAATSPPARQRSPGDCARALRRRPLEVSAAAPGPTR